ncbi:MAG TPA: hypothetical protein VNM92_18595 [Thermoanaerobaculia bacterium]|nr:hypothetical protein [Thermoanaerobaculia bacterium]
MSVAEIGQLHSRYVRLSDKFKSLWTFHQFATGVYKNLLERELPYNIDFPQIFESLKQGGEAIQSSRTDASGMLDAAERQLGRVVVQLVRADIEITPPILRRFFEKLKRHDEKIIFHLIKFYLYSDSVEGDGRDKLDFLLTRSGEDFSEERGEFWSRDSLELRKQFQALVSVRTGKLAGQAETIDVIRTLRRMRDEIQSVTTFEELTTKKLLETERAFKHRMGDSLFHPDVLLAVLHLNLTTKNQFTRLYRMEEQRILEDSRKLMDHEGAISRGFGDGNPQLLEEIGRFRGFKQEFDASLTGSNLKHDVISQLKTSIANVLAQLDRGLDGRSAETQLPELTPDRMFQHARQTDAVESLFGSDPLLHEYLVRIVTSLESYDSVTAEQPGAGEPSFEQLRLEPWEADALAALRTSHRERSGDSEELFLLFLRSAALRIKIDEEACQLAAVPRLTGADQKLMTRIKQSLDRAKELDKQFGEMLQDHLLHPRPNDLHHLYRSRFRLLRGFSGLWLIYDKRATIEG